MKVYDRQLFNFHVAFSLPQFWRSKKPTTPSHINPDLEAGRDQDESGFSTQMEVDKSGISKLTYRASRPPISSIESEKMESSETESGRLKDSNEGKETDIFVVVDNSDNSSPNLLLNCHDRVSRGEIYFYAAFGVILQVGALIYFGIITYNPPVKGEFFLKDGKRIVGYAFPCAAAGTILLFIGLFICAWVVEDSTTETCYEAPNHQLFVVWLQKDHTVNDQVFKPYAIYPAGERKYITMSRRNINRPGRDEESGQRLANHQDNNEAQDPLRNRSLAPTTLFGSLIALIGFVSQFIGMRGLNWTASVVQLVATLIVTGFRAIVRRGLNKPPVRTPLLSNTELDWFSLTFGNLATAPWAKAKHTSADEHVAAQEKASHEWKVRTGGNQPYRSLQRLHSDITEAREKSAAHKMMLMRQMLCKLSKWKSSVRGEAALLSRAIEAVAETLLGGLSDTKLVWTIPAKYKGEAEDIFIELEKKGGKWRVEEQNIEAILSLWLYSTSSAGDTDTDHRNLRLYGPVHLKTRLSRDLNWWMSEVRPELLDRESAEIFGREGECAKRTKQKAQHLEGEGSEREGSEREGSEREGSEREDSEGKNSEGGTSKGDTSVKNSKKAVVGFTSGVQDGTDETVKTDTVQNPSKKCLVVECEDKRERLFSRDLLFAFLRAVAKMPEVILESARSRSQVKYRKMKDDWKQLKLKSDSLSSLARKLERIGFGTLSDIYFDLVMPLSLERKLTNIKDVLDEAIEQAQRYERTRQWTKLVETCCCLLNLSQQFDLENESSGPLAVAVCVEFLYRLRHEADLQGREGRTEEELTTQLKILEEEFASMEESWKGSSVFSRIRDSLVKSNGGYATTFDVLIGSAPKAIEKFPESFNILDEHQELMETNDSGGTLYWDVEELGKIDSFGWSPLHYAANWQLDNVRIYILESGDVLSLRDLMGRTPLHHACLNGNKKAVDLLLDWDAPIEVAGNDGITPIHCAVLSGSIDILKKLVDKYTRKSILHVDRNERHPIHWAAIQGRIELVLMLRDDIDRTDRYGWACIHLAVIYGHTHLLEKIIYHFSSHITLRDGASRTPLHLAVGKKSLKAVKVLIEAGAKADVKDKSGLTPLHMAVDQKDIADMLLVRGADINEVDNEGRTPLYLAAMDGTLDVVALLIDKGARVATRAEDGRTPLHMALSRGQDGLEIAKKLLGSFSVVFQRDLYVNASAVDGATPLHIAAEHGPLEAVQILLDLKADINQTDDFGQTALLIAIYNTKWGIAELLLQAGADVNADSRVGYTPLLGAVMGGQEQIVGELLRKDVDVNAADEDGFSSIHLAISRGHSNILRRLLDSGASIGAVVDSQTPLHIAVRHGRAGMIQILLRRGADTKPLNNFGFTPLQYAVYRGDLEIVKEFVTHDKSSAPDAPKAALQRGEDGDTPLHTLCRWIWLGRNESQICEILEELLSVAPDIDMINAMNDEGRTPLDLARSQMDEYPAFIKKLTEKGAKPSSDNQPEESLVIEASLDA
jgi:ankyrin repeat protein